MLSFLLLVIILILHIILGLIVVLKDPKNRINQYFGLMILFAIVWISSNYLENEPLLEKYGGVLLKLDFASAILLGLFFYLFCLNFPVLKEISIKTRVIIYSLALSLTILSFSNFVVKDVFFKNHTIQFSPGKGFWLYGVTLIYFLGNGLKNLFFKYKRLTGIKRSQIIYVFLGLFLTAIIALPLNLILPQFIFIPLQIARLGIYSFLFFCTLTALAITRYHLFGIEVILTEILVGVIGILLAIQIFTAPTVLWRIVNGAIFILFCIGGFLLIRYTIREIKRREELEKISQAKSEFISITSHQLRTPLSAIKGYLSMVLEGTYGGVPERLKRVLENVYISNERMIKLVNAFLDVSRIELGREELKLEKNSIEDLISETVSEFDIEARKKNLYLKFEKPKIPLPKFLFDREKIKEVISNLIDNAIKYTQKGGIEIKCKVENAKCKIEIRDTGEGLTKEEISKLFESFSRGTAGQKYWTEGAGIGLYISRKFVELHGGKIWAESEGKGKGSSFFIELPIK